MAHEYTNTALSILRDLVVLDRYQRASDRPDAFRPGEGTVSLLEIFLSRFMKDFLDLEQEMARNGQQPLEIHIESGANASRVVPSALLAALFGENFVTINPPEIIERFNIPDWLALLIPFLVIFDAGEARGGILDLDIRPASEEGDITLAWHAGRQGLALKLQFETAGTEIRGIADVVGDFEVDITGLEVLLLFAPHLNAKRLMWECRVGVFVTLSEPDLDTERQISDKIGGTLKKMLTSDVVALIGALLGAGPLRPVEERPTALADIQAQLDADIDWYNSQHLGAEIPDLEIPEAMRPPARLQDADRIQLFAALVFQGLNESLYEASMLPSNLRSLLPPSQSLVEWVKDRLDEELADADLGLDSLLSVLEERVPPLVERFARDRLELAHLVNRTDSFTSVSVVEDDGQEAHLVVDHERLLNDAGEPAVVECMRYLISLDTIAFENPEARGGARVECSLGVWHPMLELEGEAYRAGTIDEDEVAVLDRVEATERVIFSEAALNLSSTCFLEWGGKLRLKGKVEADVLGGSEDFVHELDISRDVGLFGRDGQSVTHQLTADNGKFTIHYRVQQLPYARAYDWVRVGFSRIQLPPVSPSVLPRGASLVIEAFVNDATHPFRRELVHNYVQTINLDGWTYDVIYPEGDVGTELSIALHAVVLDSVTNLEVSRFEAARIIPRFSDDELAAVDAEDLIAAAADGAIAEWGIPVGLPMTAFVMLDDDAQLRATVTVQNQRFDTAKIPAASQPKKFDIEFPSVFIENDTDHGLSGVGEIRFGCSISVRAAGQSDEDPPQFSWSDETRLLEAEDPVDLTLPGPPKRSVVARPGDDLQIRVDGLDFDWPPFDPNDRMGTATLRVAVPAADNLDHRSAGLLTSRASTNDFEARIRITTTSRPPAPRLFFQGLPDVISGLSDVPQGTVTTLEYDGLVNWATSSRLARSIDDGANWLEEARLSTGESTGTFDVTSNQTTQYRLEVTNIAGTTFGRVITIKMTA